MIKEPAKKIEDEKKDLELEQDASDPKKETHEVDALPVVEEIDDPITEKDEPLQESSEPKPPFKINFDYKQPGKNGNSEDTLDDLVKSDQVTDELDKEEEDQPEKEVDEDEIEEEDEEIEDKKETPEVEESLPKRIFDEKDIEEKVREDDHAASVNLEKEEFSPSAIPDRGLNTRRGVEDSEHPIPNLRSQMPTSGIYSNQHPEGIARPEHHSFFQDRNVARNSHPRHKNSLFPFLMLAVVSLLVVGGAVYLIKGNFKAPVPTPTPIPTIEPTATPEPTSEPVTITRSEFTVKVLNGTSKAGLAASASAKLSELGYKTEKTSNATNSAFTKTIVRVKSEDNQDLLSQVIKDLVPDFASEGQINLGKTTTYDVEIILGQE